MTVSESKFMNTVNWTQVVVGIFQSVLSGVFVGLVIYWLDERRAKRERRLSDYRIASDWEKAKLKASLRNFDLTKANLSGYNFVKANLEGAMMKESEILGTNFNQANLRHSDFRKSRIVSADFIKAMAYKADFSGATITASLSSKSPSDFTRSVLKQAKFIKTYVANANFSGADLKGADFSGTTVMGCDFSDSDLTDSIWKNVGHVENCIWKDAAGISQENFPPDLWKEIQRQNVN